MEKQPKRRLLSLSLSQPAKTSRRLKLKRHASATSENESRVLPCETLQEVNNTRESVEMNESEERSNLFARKTGDEPVTKPQPSDSDDSSLPPISIQLEKQSISKQKSEDSAGVNINTRKVEKEPAPNIVRESMPCWDDDDCDFVKPPCRGKKTEKVPLKDSSCNSHSNAIAGNELNENREVESSCTSIRASSSSPGTSKTTTFEDASGTAEQCGISTCDTSPSRDVSAQPKPVETVSVPKDEEYFELLQCPLCGKIFEKLSSKTCHLKSCASKRKVSTQQLLEALELQRRQASERKALGLPAISPSVEKVKKPAISKKETRANSKLDSNLKMDSNFQLALALSLSRQDNEKVVQDSTARVSTSGICLDHFGFTGKPVLNAVQPRPACAPVSKGKSKGTTKRTPALLTRTAEERQRILTEKVAMILMEEVASGKDKGMKDVTVQSSFLQECLDVQGALWAKSHTSPSKNDRTSYYVQNLRSFISPSKVEMGSKVMHLSQVVGRFNTPTTDNEQQVEEPVVLNSPTDEEGSSDTSSQQAYERQDPSHIEMELRAKLFSDWASMVNNATMGDVTIYPQEGRDVPAHKMVLHVRCPRILTDICRQRNPLTGNEVEVIMWSKTPHAAALAFLEYIYCGSVKSIRVLSNDLSSICWLADHYKVGDLTRYLKSISESSQTPSQVALSVVKDFNKDREEHVSETEEEAPEPALSENVALRRLSRVSTDIFTSRAGTPTRSDADSIHSEATVTGVANPSLCSSPDMFGDDEAGQESANLEDKRPSMGNSRDPDNVHSKLTENLFSNDERSPSRSGSISSEKSGIVARTSPSPSRCASASSDNTVIICSDSQPPSPALSNTSAATELLDFNQSGTGTSRPGSSLNDSKRKHSNSSEDGNSSLCKRVCSAGSNLGHQSGKEDSDVEFCDLTQDSDSNTSFPVIQNKFSGNSEDKISISSGDNSDVNIKSPERAKNVINEQINHSDGDNRNCELAGHDSADVENAAPYINPVWDGFEDLNYGDPFLNEPHIDLNSATTTSAGSPKPVKDACPSTSNDTSLISENKTPVKIGTSSEKKSDDDAGDTKSCSDCEITCTSPGSPALSKQSKPSSSGFDALLDDSLNINDSILLQAEKSVPKKLTQRETKGTPVNRILSSEPEGVTPLANYSAMKTPELKRELQKYGLKPNLGKRKGKLMLRHIYNELHPWVPLETNQSLPDRISLSQPSCSSSMENKTPSEPNSRRLSFSDSDNVEKNTNPFDKDSRNSRTDSDSDSNCSSRSGSTSRQEIEYLEGDGDNDDDCEPRSQATSKRVNRSDLPRIVSNFIRNDKELHHKVLEYEPIWIEKLQADLLSNGFKCGIEALMAFLDEKCITFRSEPSGPRVRKKKLKSVTGKKTAPTTDILDSD